MDIKGVKWTSPKDSASFSGEGGACFSCTGSCQVEVVQVCAHLSLEANSGFKSCVWCQIHKGVDWTVKVCSCWVSSSPVLNSMLVRPAVPVKVFCSHCFSWYHS